MSEAQERIGKTRRVRLCRIGCDRLALILGVAAWISVGTTYTFDFNTHLSIALVFANGAAALNLLATLALIVSSIWERCWGAHYFIAGFLVLPLLAIFAIGMWIVVFYGGV